MTNREYKLAAERLARFDLTEHQARIAATATERAKIDQGIQHGLREVGLLSGRISDLKYGPLVDPDQAADALMSKGEVAIEVDTLEKLEVERAGLHAGLKRLRELEEVAGRAESDAKNAAHRELAGCVAELAPVLLEQAQQAAELLAAVYAAACALVDGVGSVAARGVADRIEPALAEISISGLLKDKQISVPAEMLNLLEAGRKPIDELGRRWPSQVAVPGRAINPALVVMGSENSALRSEIARLRAGR
jgi:hypothetical protein